MRVIVVIASSTRGFTTPRDGTPTVINPCPSTQDQDESLTVSLDGYVTGSADRVDAAMGMNGFRLFQLARPAPRPGGRVGRVYAELMATRAVISGRRTYDHVGHRYS